jgi:hypothetical protein
MTTEMDHVRAFRAADGEPDEVARVAARVALLERIEAAASPLVAPGARPPRRRLLAGGLGLAATALAALALVVGLDSGGVQPATAAAFLRHAAAVVEQGADVVLEPGRYWYTRSEGEQDAARWTREDWHSVTGSGRVLQRGDYAMDVTIDERDPVLYSFFPRGLTHEQLRALPTDVDALYARLHEAGQIWAGQKDNQLGPEHEMLTFVGDWLRSGPPPPAALRAALFRVAARLPGIELLGPVRDATGRPGTAVALTGAGQRRELVFDPQTAELLEERTVDAASGKLSYRATYVASGEVGALDERPEP